MKKLMIVALAVASCTAMAAEEVVNNEVYDLSFTTKSLELATKTLSIKIQGATWSNAYEKASEAYWKESEKIIKACAGLGLSYELPCFDEVWNSTTNGGAKVKGTLKFTVPNVNTKGVAATKVVSKKINGVAIKDGEGKYKTYLWDNTKNEFYNARDAKAKNYKYWAWELPFDYSGLIATDDGKASLNVKLAELRGVATGTCDKNTKVIKSVAGNIADTGSASYGTWKFSYNKRLTGKSTDVILTDKKVELAK